MFDLTGKNAVVTGGASGIGEAIARRFRAAGAQVLIGDIGPAPTGWDGSYRRTDVTQEADIVALVDEAVATFGSLDIMVSNAGIAVTGDIENTGSAEAARMEAINTRAMVIGMREAAKRMKPGSVILNTASVAGGVGIPSLVEYSMGKAAVISATKAAALDLGARNIRVNAICPGAIATPLSQNAPLPLLAVAPHVTALGRAGTPEEIAALAHFLASDDASYVTGQAIFADGGWNIGTTMQTLLAAIEKAQAGA